MKARAQNAQSYPDFCGGCERFDDHSNRLLTVDAAKRADSGFCETWNEWRRIYSTGCFAGRPREGGG